MDLAFHRLEALRAPQKPVTASESPCSSCSLAQSSWTLSVSSSWKPEVEEAVPKKPSRERWDLDGFEKGRRCWFVFLLKKRSDAYSFAKANVASVNTVLVGRVVSSQVLCHQFLEGSLCSSMFFFFFRVGGGGWGRTILDKRADSNHPLALFTKQQKLNDLDLAVQQASRTM